MYEMHKNQRIVCACGTLKKKILHDNIEESKGKGVLKDELCLCFFLLQKYYGRRGNRSEEPRYFDSCCDQL